MIVGMDFGTTNSGMAVYNGSSVQILPLDPANNNPRVARTALYITNDQEVHIGRAAVDRYFEHNVGRPVRTKKVWIGEIEVYAEDMYYVTDAYAWVDVSSPGRLLLSVKTRLRDHDHPGTVVGQFYYPLEDLISLYLQITKIRAEKLLGQELNQVVLGRPVRFSTDPKHDRLAQGRLLQAAFRAGYERVSFQYEPIAAAYSYETTLTHEQNVLVFDFGGGTLDLTVMRLGNPQNREVLATGGIPVAGDVFDELLVRNKLPKHFGEGSLYGSRHKALTIPKWIYDSFSSWQTMLDLQTADNRRMLQEIAQTAQRKHQIEALLSLVSSNYGVKVFDDVEKAKRVLSEKRGAEIRLDGPGFKVREFVTRSEFERIIKFHVDAIKKHLLETVQASGLRPEQIDVVIRTGGSAEIPIFDEMLRNHFGDAKVRSVDTFSSVTAGLGVIAHELEQGTVDLPVYTPSDVTKPPQAQGLQPSVAKANLDLLKLRIKMAEGLTAVSTTEPQIGLVAIGDEKEITAVSIPAQLATDEAISLDEHNITHPIKRAIIAELDDPLLLLTSFYRFLLITPRQLLDLQATNLTITDLHHLEARESLCGIAHWNEIKQQERLLIVTTTGLARAYPINVMVDSIEAPIPFRFENRLEGLPNIILGVNKGDELLVMTNEAKAIRLPLTAVGVRGLQAINCGKTDRVATALLVQPNSFLSLLTADGYGRRLLAEWVPSVTKANQKGKSQIARRSPLIGVSSSNEPFWLATTDKLRHSDKNGRLPLENSTKTARALKLGTNEIIQTLIHI